MSSKIHEGLLQVFLKSIFRRRFILGVYQANLRVWKLILDVFRFQPANEWRCPVRVVCAFVVKHKPVNERHDTLVRENLHESLLQKGVNFSHLKTRRGNNSEASFFLSEVF